ncbi:MAG: SpvB/TcaC N-terminal domain-containing protein [Paludibacteraceae bacterium]
MKSKYIIILGFLLFSSEFGFSQYQNYELKESDSEAKTYIGRDYVKMLPGYRFTASINKSVNAKVSNGKLSDTEINDFLSNTGSANPQTLTAIDTSLGVGEIPISSSISPSGAKLYNVPIDVPSGNQGFQPNLSLSYNSQAGNGIMGMGWSISGLSSIERVNKNYYFDGKTDAIKSAFSIEDALELDGNRLVEIQRTNSEVEYATVTGNIKVKAFYLKMIFTTVVTQYIVYFDNGSIGAYSRKGFSYRLDQLRNINGDIIDYSYESDNVDINGGNENVTCYLKEIKYGSGNRIKFYYEDRPDQILNLPCSQISTSEIYRKRLRSIETLIDSSSVNIYKVLYTNIDPRNSKNINDVSKLTEIQFSSHGRELNPLKFYYSKIDKTLEEKSVNLSFNDLTNLNIIKGHFNINTEEDAILTYPKGNTYQFSLTSASYCYPADNKIKVYQDSKNGNILTTEILAENNFLSVLSADVDGDSKDEIIKINADLKEGWEELKFKIYKSNLLTNPRKRGM